MIVLLLILAGLGLFLAWDGCFLGCSYHACPFAGQEASQTPSGSVGYPGGHNVSFDFSIQTWNFTGCAIPPLPVSGRISFSQCIGGPCGAALSIYTASNWSSASQGRGGSPLWCYSSTTTGTGVGACSSTGDTSFTTEVPGADAEAHPSPNSPPTFVFVISSLTVGESYSLELNTTSERVSAAP